MRLDPAQRKKTTYNECGPCTAEKKKIQTCQCSARRKKGKYKCANALPGEKKEIQNECAPCPEKKMKLQMCQCSARRKKGNPK